MTQDENFDDLEHTWLNLPPLEFSMPTNFQETMQRAMGIGRWASNPPPREETQPFEPDIFSPLEFYQKYPLYGAVHRMLSAQGATEVRDWIRRTYEFQLSHTDLNDWVGLDETMKRNEFVLRGMPYECNGKFVARLSKVMSMLYNIKIDDEKRQYLGNMIDQHWIGGDKHQYYFDVCNCIDWRSGEFGEKSEDDDKGSCWWYEKGLDNPHSRVSRFSALMPHKALGLRLWVREGDNYYGVGRVWVVRTRIGLPILFNSYGFSNPMIWAARLSKTLGFERYCKVRLWVQPDFPVNSESGVLLAYPETHTKFDYRFNFDD